MISGTSNISLILGPINSHFWARGRRIYGFYYTKLLQQILESIWGHLGKILFLHICESKFRTFRKANPPCFFKKESLYNLSIWFQNIFTKMRNGR